MLSLLFLFIFAANPQSCTTRDVYLMGTTFKATLCEPDHAKALNQLEQIIEVVESTEQELSTWKEDSELSKLNASPKDSLFEASVSMCTILKKVQRWNGETGGAFDPTIGKLAAVWGIHGKFRIPDEDEIQAALQQTGYSNIHMDGCRVTKSKDVVIDPGGFGKGEALDRVMALAAKENFAPLLLDFGGQLAARGFETNATIADPFTRSKDSSVTLSIHSGSLSTSGGSERNGYVNGKRIGHILDPHTGHPVPSFGSVTVWSESAADADILSTALYVMGPEKGFEWAVKNKIAACFLTANGTKKTAKFSASLR